MRFLLRSKNLHKPLYEWNNLNFNYIIAKSDWRFQSFVNGRFKPGGTMAILSEDINLPPSQPDYPIVSLNVLKYIFFFKKRV